MTQPARIPSTCPGEAAWCRSVMATLRSRPVTGMRGGSWVSSPRRTRATRVRRRRCNSVGVPGGASGPLTTGMCEHVVAGCHRALGCLGQGGAVAKSSDSPQARTPAQTSRRHCILRARGSLLWRAAGLLRRLRCGPVRAANAPPATEPLSAAPGRAPGLCPAITRGFRCIAT